MENSSQQLANVHGAFEIDGPVPSGPVLLVDDVVDSPDPHRDRPPPPRCRGAGGVPVRTGQVDERLTG
jgi:hypothetical protein